MSMHTLRFCKKLRHPMFGPCFALYALLAGLCMGAPLAQAQIPFDITETWSGSGLNGWTGGGSQVALTNVVGCLEVRFQEQAYPMPGTCIARYGLASGSVVTNLSFRFLATDRPPSAVRLVFFTTSGEEWGLPLSGITNGVWVAVSHPIGYNAGWTLGPRSTKALFDQSVSEVSAVGVFVLRDASTRAQSFAVDDFRIQGVEAVSGFSIAGSVAYEGEQVGGLKVVAQKVSDLSTSAWAEVAGPGAYEILGLQAMTDYQVTAFLDSSGNGVQDFWEARGSLGGPVRVEAANVMGISFALTDPTSRDGLPYWWLKHYFDMSDPRTAGDLQMADVDSDGDGMLNYAEFRAGTDPTNRASVFEIMIESDPGQAGPVLRWHAAPGRTYSLWSTEDLGAGFTLREGGIPAEWPTNAYPDAGAGNAAKRFYRVEVE